MDDHVPSEQPRVEDEKEPEEEEEDPQEGTSQSLLPDHEDNIFDDDFDDILDLDDDFELPDVEDVDDGAKEKKSPTREESSLTSYQIPKKSKSVPAASSSSGAPPLHRATSHLPKETKRAQMIEALPQPGRRRGLSVQRPEEAEKAKEDKHKDERKKTPGSLKGKSIPGKHFYKSSKETRAKGGAARYLSTTGFKTDKDILQQRRDKLKEIELAKKHKRDEAQEEEGNRAQKDTDEEHHAAVKVKQSKSKSSKLLEMCNIRPNTKKVKITAPPPLPKISVRRTSSHESVGEAMDSKKRSRHASEEGGRGTNKPLFLEEVQKESERMPKGSRQRRRSGEGGIRRTAETVEDPDTGHRTIRKMKFDNVMSNVCSQDVTARPLPQREPLQYESISSTSEEDRSGGGGGTTETSSPVEEEDTGEAAAAMPVPPPPPPPEVIAGVPISILSRRKKEVKRSVRFRLNPRGELHVDICFIAKEGKGKPVSHSNLRRHEVQPQPEPEITAFPPSPLQMLRQAVHSLGSSPIGYEDMLKKALEWTPAWLKEQESIREAPPVQGADLRLSHVPSVFSSYRDYCYTYYPLLLHEMWSMLFQDFQESSDRRRPVKLVPVDQQLREKWVELRLLGLLTEQQKRSDSALLNEGFLVRLELRCVRGRKEEIRPVFAFVTSSKVRPRRNNNDSEVYVKVLEEGCNTERRRQLRFVLDITVLVKKMAPDVILRHDRTVEATGVSRIRPMLRNFKAVEDLQKSYLFGPIVRPSEFLPRMGARGGPVAGEFDDFRPDVRNLPLFRNLNNSQVRKTIS